MPSMSETRAALAAGSTRQELLAAGHTASSITKAKKQLADGWPKGLPANPCPRPRASRDVSTNVVQSLPGVERIVLPSGIFILYDFIKAKHPRYEATKSQWIIDVIQCWAEERAEEMGLSLEFGVLLDGWNEGQGNVRGRRSAERPGNRAAFSGLNSRIRSLQREVEELRART